MIIIRSRYLNLPAINRETSIKKTKVSSILSLKLRELECKNTS